MNPQPFGWGFSFTITKTLLRRRKRWDLSVSLLNDYRNWVMYTGSNNVSISLFKSFVYMR